MSKKNWQRVDQTKCVDKRLSAQATKARQGRENPIGQPFTEDGWKRVIEVRKKRGRQHDIVKTAEARDIEKMRRLASEARERDEMEHRQAVLRAGQYLWPAREDAMNRCG